MNGYDIGNSIQIQSDGKYVVAGGSWGTSYDLAIWRYNSDGSLDTSFGGVGYVTHNGTAGGNGIDIGNSIQIQSDGKYVIGGYSTNSYSGSSFAIWRYNPDGSLDTTFNNTGFITFGYYKSAFLIQSIICKSDEEYILVGVTRSLGKSAGLFLARYINSYQITNLDPLLDATVSNANIETDGEYGAYGIKDIILSNLEGIPIASLKVDMRNGDKNWSGLKADISLEQGKTYVRYPGGTSNIPGIENNGLTLFVPRKETDNAVWICPHAESLNEIDFNCKDGYGVLIGDEVVSIYTKYETEISETPLVDVDFDDGLFPPTLEFFSWTKGGNTNWSINGSVYQTASYSLGSQGSGEDLGHNQTAWVKADFTSSELGGRIAFDWKVSSEVNYDFLYVCVDSLYDCAFYESNYRISANVDWTNVGIDVSAGEHTITWAYSKDGSINSGSDMGWIDNIRYYPNELVSAQSYFAVSGLSGTQERWL